MAWLDALRFGKKSQEREQPTVAPAPEDQRVQRLEAASERAQKEAQVVSILWQVDEWLKAQERGRAGTSTGTSQWQMNQRRLMEQSIAGRAASNPVREAVLKYAQAQDRTGSQQLLSLLADTLKQSVLAYLKLEKLESDAQYATVSDLYQAIRGTDQNSSVESLVTPVNVTNLQAEKIRHFQKIEETVEKLKAASV